MHRECPWCSKSKWERCKRDPDRCEGCKRDEARKQQEDEGAGGGLEQSRGSSAGGLGASAFAESAVSAASSNPRPPKKTREAEESQGGGVVGHPHVRVVVQGDSTAPRSTRANPLSAGLSMPTITADLAEEELRPLLEDFDIKLRGLQSASTASLLKDFDTGRVTRSHGDLMDDRQYNSLRSSYGAAVRCVSPRLAQWTTGRPPLTQCCLGSVVVEQGGQEEGRSTGEAAGL